MEYFGLEKSDLIPGLSVIHSALDANLCNELLVKIKENHWFSNGNQMMFFGKLPSFLSPLYDIGLKMLPNFHREPLFDQCIANYYKNSQGIKPHVDLLKFDDGILIISLLGTCTMDFIKNNQIVSFFLGPGDAISLSNEARYEWKHTIPERIVDMNDRGELVKRTERISITLRSLCN
jgi:hypothetical protein